MFFGTQSTSDSDTIIFRVSINNLCRGKCKYCFIAEPSEEQVLTQNVETVYSVFVELTKHYSRILLIVEDADPFVNLESLEICRQLVALIEHPTTGVIQFFVNRKDKISLENALSFAAELNLKYPEYLEKIEFAGTFLLKPSVKSFIQEAEHSLELLEKFAESGFKYSFNFAPQSGNFLLTEDSAELQELARLLHEFACLFAARQPVFAISLLPISDSHDTAVSSSNRFSELLQEQLLRTSIRSLTEDEFSTLTYLPYQQEGLIQLLTGSTNCHSGLECWMDSAIRLTADGKIETCLFPLHGESYKSLRTSFFRSPRKFQLRHYRAQYPFLTTEDSEVSSLTARSLFRGGCPFDLVNNSSFEQSSRSQKYLSSRYQRQYRCLQDFKVHPVETAKRLVATATVAASQMSNLTISDRLKRWKSFLS